MERASDAGNVLQDRDASFQLTGHEYLLQQEDDSSETSRSLQLTDQILHDLDCLEEVEAS